MTETSSDHRIADADRAARITSIFLPSAEAELKELVDPNCTKRFVHYTNADAAYKIFKSQTIWLRNTSVMNDVSEITHGFSVVKKVLNDQVGKTLIAALETCIPGSFAKLERYWSGWAPWIRSDTYVFCASTHQLKDDEFGKLSMWRAYGNNAGVALVFKGHQTFGQEVDIGAFGLPVKYHGADEIASGFEHTTREIVSNTEWLREQGADMLATYAFTMLRAIVVTTKHLSFSEENEWRLVASPDLLESPIFERCVESVNGIPQNLLKLRLTTHKDFGLNLSLDTILDRVIVGPSAHADTTRAAIVRLLAIAGVSKASEKVWVADVPLRH